MKQHVAHELLQANFCSSIGLQYVLYSTLTLQRNILNYYEKCRFLKFSFTYALTPAWKRWEEKTGLTHLPKLVLVRTDPSTKKLSNTEYCIAHASLVRHPQCSVLSALQRCSKGCRCLVKTDPACRLVLVSNRCRQTFPVERIQPPPGPCVGLNFTGTICSLVKVLLGRAICKLHSRKNSMTKPGLYIFIR